MNSSNDSTKPHASIRLVCPECHAPVLRSGNAHVCESAECRRRYLVVDDIPKFIIEESEVMKLDDWQRVVDDGNSTTAEECTQENLP